VTLIAVTLSFPPILRPKVVHNPASAATKAFEASTGTRMLLLTGGRPVEVSNHRPLQRSNLLGPPTTSTRP
jgi:hypothetical protein